MQNKVYHNVHDRSTWPSGEWDDEPDKAQWTDETGFPCLAVRHGTSGHWCGYVGLPYGHPRHGHSYDEMYDLDVHGGLTFSGPCDFSEDDSKGVCHVPDEGEYYDLWWLGFDCAHFGDLSPGMLQYGFPFHDAEYRTLEFVKAECGRLANQL